MKLSNPELWLSVKKSRGNLGEALRIIKADYDVDITRQAIEKRIKRQPQRLEEIRSLAVDKAEKELGHLMECRTDAVRFNAVKFYLMSKGKTRGYGEQTKGQPTDLLVGIRLVNVEE